MNPRYVGPFRVLAKVGKVAYKLELPQELSRVHHTFHVSNLKKCYADEPLVMPLEGIHVDDKLQFVEEPVEIMEREIKRLKQSRIPLVKVRWNSRRGPEFTWEREDSFKQKYPQLFTNRASSSTTSSDKTLGSFLADPDEGMAMVRQSDEEVVTEQPKKIKKKRLIKQSTFSLLRSSRLLAREQSATPSVAPPSQESEGFVDFSAQTSLQIRTTVGSSSTLSTPIEESKGSDDSFYELSTLDPSEAKRWYVPRWNITNDSLLDDGFSCHTLVDRVAPHAFFSALCSMECDQLYTDFNVGATRQICLGSEVRSRAEYELELKEKLNAKYAARGKLLEEKDSEILRLKSQLAEKEAEAAEVVRLRDQVSSLSGEKSALTAEVSALKVTLTQKDRDISLLDSHATHLESALNDAQVSSLRAGFKDFKEKMEIQQEEQAQELYKRVAELEAYVMDVSGHLEGEFYPTYLTLLARRRWLLTHGIQLALLKCLKSSEY
ncbi:hypothetical protein Tco_0092923 [Tanacetum coccineum]